MMQNHPHVTVHLVLPGFIATNIASSRIEVDIALIAAGSKTLTSVQQAALERSKPFLGLEQTATLEDVLRSSGEMFKSRLGISTERCAREILDGVRRGRWRIVVGEDAKIVDAVTRAVPSLAYWKPTTAIMSLYSFIAIKAGRGGRFWLPSLIGAVYASKIGMRALRAKL